MSDELVKRLREGPYAIGKVTGEIFILTEAAICIEQQAAEIERLHEALEAIRQYGSDTLSGRANGPDDRAWQREGVQEMTRRARAALADYQEVS